MTAIGRRNVLVGGSAVMAVAGVPGAALAGALDARILALAEEHDRTFAEMNKAGDRWCEAVTEKMPPHLRNVSPLNPPPGISREELWDALKKAGDYPEVEALRAEDNRFKERCRELVGRLSQTEATTLEGMYTKMHIARRPGYGIDDDIVSSVAADLERLAGEARS